MLFTLIQMTVLIGLGVFWRFWQPAGLTADQTRLVLTSVVYNVFLPALILQVLWEAEFELQSLQYTLFGIACVLFAIIAIWLQGLVLRFDNSRLGAMILASAFPNIIFLGLPVLEKTFGTWARAVAIKLDLLATTPLLFTLGIFIAMHYGVNPSNNRKFSFLQLKAPPLWAAGSAILLSLYNVPQAPWLQEILLHMAGVVVPLMLFSLGLALNWQSLKVKNLPYVLPVIITKMFLMPLFALWIIAYFDIQGDYKSAMVMEMAMPSMVLGIVFCDRYRLDTPLYAMTVAVTTVLSLITLPIWYEILSHD